MWGNSSGFDDQTTEATFEDTSSQSQKALSSMNLLNSQNQRTDMFREPEENQQSIKVTELSNLQLTKEVMSLRRDMRGVQSELKGVRQDIRALFICWKTGVVPNRLLILQQTDSQQMRESSNSEIRMSPYKYQNRPLDCQKQSSHLVKRKRHVQSTQQIRRLLKVFIQSTQYLVIKSSFSKISIWIQNCNDSETTSNFYFTVKDLTDAEDYFGTIIKWTNDFSKKLFAQRKSMMVKLMFTAKKLNAEKTTVALAIRAIDRFLADYQNFQIQNMEALGQFFLRFSFLKKQNESFITYDSNDLITMIDKYSRQLIDTLRCVVCSTNHLDWALVVANQWNKQLKNLKVSEIFRRNIVAKQPKNELLLLPVSTNLQSGINFESFHLIIQFILLNYQEMSTQRIIVAAALLLLMSKKFIQGKKLDLFDAFREKDDQELFEKGEILEVFKKVLYTSLELGGSELDKCLEIAQETSDQMETQYLSEFMPLNIILNDQNHFVESQTFQLTACDLYRRNKTAEDLFVLSTTKIKTSTNKPTRQKSRRKE